MVVHGQALPRLVQVAYSASMEAVSTSGGPAPALPLGRTAAIDRYKDDARARGSNLDPDADVPEGSLGTAAYLALAYEHGLMDPRPRNSRGMRRVLVILPHSDGFAELCPPSAFLDLNG